MCERRRWKARWNRAYKCNIIYEAASLADGVAFTSCNQEQLNQSHNRQLHGHVYLFIHFAPRVRFYRTLGALIAHPTVPKSSTILFISNEKRIESHEISRPVARETESLKVFGGCNERRIQSPQVIL